MAWLSLLVALTTTATIDRNQVERHILRQAGTLDGCVGTQAGELVLKLVIDQAGKVTTARVQRTTLPEDPAGVSACVEARVARWRFPPLPQGSGPVIIIYPLIIKPR